MYIRKAHQDTVLSEFCITYKYEKKVRLFMLIAELTDDQQRLIYVIEQISKMRDEKLSFLNHKLRDRLWVKELSILVLAYYLTIKGVFETYDYAPTSSQLFGRVSYTLNLSYEAIDDIEDLRELNILEKIRLSTAKHGFVTAYRLTEKGAEVLKELPAKIKNDVDSYLHCEHCGKLLSFTCQMATKLALRLDCHNCNKTHIDISFVRTEDVSYVSEPYFLKGLTGVLAKNG